MHKRLIENAFGLNPNLKLQEVLIINGEEELGDIEEFDWTITQHLRPLFPDDHMVHRVFGGDWSFSWVGDF